MATFQKLDQFVEDMAHGVHDFSADQVIVALTAAANAPVATDAVLADLIEITYTFLSSRLVTTSASTQTSGTYQLTFQPDLVLTASGGSVGPFRYVVHYNDAPVTPLDPLIQFYDHGTEVTLADGETFTIDYNAGSGFFQLT